MSAYYQWRTFARDVAITCGVAVVGGLTVATVADALLPSEGPRLYLRARADRANS